MTMETSAVIKQAPSRLALRKSLCWRIHFWAALIATPFALLAALSGLLYVFTPQIEAQLYRQLDTVTPGTALLPLDQLVALAQAQAGDRLTVRTVQMPRQAGDSLRVIAEPRLTGPAGDHAGHASAKAMRTVFYIDPYRGVLLGRLQADQRFSSWAAGLHASLLHGESWRWLIELAASWLLVMLLTGIYLWWPRHGKSGLPQAGARGRKAWRQWHGFIGVALGLISAVMLITGLTWSKYGGEQIRALRDAVGQTPPRAPQGLQSISRPGQAPLGWQAIWHIARQQAPQTALLLTAPTRPSGLWRITSASSGEPTRRFELLLDGYSGARRYYADWSRQTAFAKATAIGIPFHRGEFGCWNQALLLVFGAGLLFSLLSGWWMYLRRCKAGQRRLPVLLPGAWRSMPAVVWLASITLLALLPLLAISAACLVLLEYGLHRRRSRLHKVA